MTYKYACPGCFKDMVAEQITYCSACRRHLFDNKSVSTKLPFTRDEIAPENAVIQLNIHRGKIERVERGMWILQPIPSLSGVRYIDDIPANRHLMMQIAGQVFGLQTAPSGMIYFKDGEAAYITKRFDMIRGRLKKSMDICSLSGLEQGECENNPDALSYMDIARMIKRHLPATTVELEKFFSQLLFNYVICNTQTYGNRFAFLQRESGDFGLAPAHNLFSTILHYDNQPLLPLPLFDSQSTAERPVGLRYTQNDFLRFANHIGLKESLARRFMEGFSERKDTVFNLVERSFMSSASKKIFKKYYLDRLYDISETYGRPRIL